MIGAATNLFEQLFETSSLPRSVVNAEGEIVFMNKAFRQLIHFEDAGNPPSLLIDLLRPLLTHSEYESEIEYPTRLKIRSPHCGKIVLSYKTGQRLKIDFKVNYVHAANTDYYSYEWTDVSDKVGALKALKSTGERLDLAAEILNLGVWEYEFESQHWFLNNRMFDIFGQPKDQFNSNAEAFNHFFDEDNLKLLYKHWDEAKDTGSKLNIDLFINHPEKGKRKINITGKCLYDSANIPWRFVGTIADITEKRKKEEDILLEKSRLKSLIDSQSNFLVRLDTSGKINFCNQSFRNKFTLKLNCNGEHSLFEFIANQEQNGIQHILETCLKNTGQIFIHRTTCIDSESKSVIVEWEFIAHTETGFTEIQGFGRDITERIQLTDKVQETLENIKSTINNFNNVSIWSVDTNYRVIALNNRFRNEFLEFNKNPLEIGDLILDKVRPEIRDTWKALYDDVFANGSKQLEYEIDGHVFEISLNPIQVENKTTGIAIYGLDITENRRKEEALRESEERLQFAIEGNQYVVWETNIEKNQVWFSDSFSSIFGYPLQDVLALSTWTNIIHPDDLQHASQTLQKLVEGSMEQFHTEFRMKDGDGAFRWVINMGKTFEKDSNGKVKRVVGLLSDITERKVNEEKMRETMEKLEKFAHLTSHNLRRPLANIIGISNLLKEEESLTEPIFDLVIEIRKSAHALDDVVKEMTDAISFGKTNITSTSPVKLKKVWFIDDDEINNMLSMRMLNRVLPESESMAFLNAEEALEILMGPNSNIPDSIFLDINMPCMNGWEFLDELTVRNIHIPVYMLTSSIDPRDQEKAGSYEYVKDFISKPLREDRLKMLLK